MTTRVSTYDPAGIVLVIGGSLITGFEEGTFIEVSRVKNTWDYSIGPDGQEGIRVKSNNRSAQLRFTLRQSSTANYQLSRALRLDETQGGVLVPVSISDVNSPNTQLNSNGFCMKPPVLAYAPTVQPRTWEWTLTDMTQLVDGIPTQAVLQAALATL